MSEGDRARLMWQREDGSYKRCAFPCQSREGSECSVAVAPPGRERPKNAAHPIWEVTGPPDAPTLSPSINCQDEKCWHGHIIAGRIVHLDKKKRRP